MSLTDVVRHRGHTQEFGDGPFFRAPPLVRASVLALDSSQHKTRQQTNPPHTNVPDKTKHRRENMPGTGKTFHGTL